VSDSLIEWISKFYFLYITKLVEHFDGQETFFAVRSHCSMIKEVGFFYI
jgi:hypothetical protein